MFLFQILILDRNPSEPETVGVPLGVLPISGAHEEAGGSGPSHYLISPANVDSLVEKGVMSASQGRNLLKYSVVSRPEGQQTGRQQSASTAGVAATARAASLVSGDVAACSPTPPRLFTAGRRDQRCFTADSAYLYRCFGYISS